MAKEKAEPKKVKRPTAEKRAIQNNKRRLRNKMAHSEVRTAIRHLTDSLAKGTSQEVAEKLNSVYSLLDKGVKRGMYKSNYAGRKKSRLAALAGKVASA